MSDQVWASLAAQMKTDGAICIRRALDADSMRMAREAFDWSLEHPGPSHSQFEGTAKAPGRFYQDLLNPDVLTGYRDLVENSNAADIVAKLWGAPDVWFMYEQVFLKEGGESRRTPWHQDSSYLPIEGEQIAVMWISFDSVARADSLEFVRGSHRGVLYDGSRFDPGDDTAPLYGDGSMPRLPDIEGNRKKFDIVSWDVEPGDVLIFHPRMLHGGAPTHPGTSRRTLSLRFFGENAVFAQRPVGGGDSKGEGPKVGKDGPRVGEANSPIGDMYARLSPGDPFRHQKFPKLRPRR